MSVTGTTIRNNLPVKTAPSDSEALSALKQAIAASWPMIKLRQYEAEAVTLAANTFTYALSGLSQTPSDNGIARVYLHHAANEPPRRLRGCRQYYDQDDGTWTLVVPPDIVAAYAGKALDIEYQYPHPTITNLDETITLPYDYLVDACRYWYAQIRLTDQPHDARYWDTLMVAAREDMRESRKRALTPGLQPLPMTTKDRLSA